MAIKHLKGVYAAYAPSSHCHNFWTMKDVAFKFHALVQKPLAFDHDFYFAGT